MKMADRTGRKRQIERMGYAGYTELVEGNTVRRAPLESDLREEDVSSRLIRNRERTRQMNMAYVLFLTAAAVLCVAFCIIFLQLQTQSTQLQKKAASLQLQLKDLQMENDTVYNEIVSGVDLEKVRETAVNRFGMAYPTEEQIVRYIPVSKDYVRQYAEIPG